VDRTAELRRQHEDEIARLDSRVADIERKYTEKESKVESGRRTATAGLQEEVKEDVANVKQAVGDLRTTTPENWWDRHEQAMKRAVDDVEADVRRLAGKVEAVRPQGTSGTTAEGVSTAPFESRRDRLVADLRARADAMERALDTVKAKGARETEINDTKARVKKLRDDVDRLASAKADDWWDVSKARVDDYIDRVQASVDRLDNNRP
jgi:chromosome segregation ATPase